MIASAIGGCASYPVTDPVDRLDPNGGYRVETYRRPGASPRLFLVLSFSGGGTRAAALSYGVLKALSETTVTFDGMSRRLSDEVDIITSVSGGSFTAAYYGLYGDRTFVDFKERFLLENVQGALLAGAISPINWTRFASPLYGRSDMASEYYDEILFNEATYADLLVARGPYVLINATDIMLGTRFGFEQAQFDLICANLLTYPIARAVAASSAVPVLLTAITINNHAHQGCGYRPPSWVAEELSGQGTFSRRYLEAQRINAYQSPGYLTYIHLFDGGLSDNLGLRAAVEKAVVAGSYGDLIDQGPFSEFDAVAHIVVNAQTAADLQSQRSPRPPGLTSSMLAATSVPLNRYNFETVELFERQQAELVEYMRAKRCRNPSQPCAIERFLVQVSFEAIKDTKERAFLKSLPTSFSLDEDAVDRTIRAAQVILDESREFQALIQHLNAITASQR